jgi:hypothetical protein
MSRATINDMVVLGGALIGLAAYLGLILVPAWSSYSRIWERLAATVLSLYVVAVLMAIGVGAALAVVYYWG